MAGTTCQKCHRAVFEADVDAAGLCVFCQGSREPAPPAAAPRPAHRPARRGATRRSEGSAAQEPTLAPATPDGGAGGGDIGEDDS
ncbi:hypothetical protein LCGC14_0519290 [marine sediment metagenome]|uniref:Uncharacterized protein n=1 Tax=marine sediment metagenome TaxID=412755 RepID=A0A0F9V757_9ZZZZ